MPTRLPPHDLNAERGLLARLFTNPENTDVVLAAVRPDDLYSHQHQGILAAAIDLHTNGHPIDVIAVTSQMNTAGHEITLGDLHDTVLQSPSGNVENNIRIIHDTKALRDRIATSQEIIESAYKGVNDPDHDTKLRTLLDHTTTHTHWYVTPPDLTTIPKTKPILATNKGNTVFPDSGYSVVYGGMASGKSWLALAAISQAARDGARVAMIDAEMTAEVTYRRLSMLGSYHPDGSGAAGDTDRFRYVPGDRINAGVLAQVKQWLTEAETSLVVIDSVGAAGGHSNHADEYIEWHHATITPFVQAGIAVIGIDHNTRSKQTQADRAQHGALGTVVKSNEADLIYEASPSPQMFSAAEDGFTPLTLRKDRHGIWSSRVNRTVARLSVTHPHGMRWELLDVDPGSAYDVNENPTTEQVAAWMLDQLRGCRASGLTPNALKSMVVQGSATLKNDAVKLLKSTGQVRVQGDGTLRLPENPGAF